ASFTFTATLKDHWRADKQAWSALLCEYHLAHVDVSGKEACLAIGQVVLPQPPEAFIETELFQVGPGCAEVISPGRKRLGIIFPEYVLADDRKINPLSERLQDLRRRQHPAGEYVTLDEIDLTTILGEHTVLNGDRLDAGQSARQQPIAQLRKIFRPELL